MGSIPGPGISPEGGNGNPLPYSCLENAMDRRAWWATVHGVAKSRTQLNTEHTHTTQKVKHLQFKNVILTEAQTFKNLPTMRETQVPPLSREDPLEKRMALTPVFVGLPWWLRHGQRNGYPLQYSCMENSMDRGSW